MAISKRLRYEIMRRDNHACRYCGATAPDATLTIDHVVPVALGGADDASNLVTACRDCNAGKSSATPDTSLVDAVRTGSGLWERAKAAAAEGRTASMYVGFDDEISAFDTAWVGWTYPCLDAECGPNARHKVYRDEGWDSSLRVWLLRGLPFERLTELIPIAMKRKGVDPDDRWRYFCGCAWRAITDFEADTKDQYEELRSNQESIASKVKRLTESVRGPAEWQPLIDALETAFPDVGALDAEASDYPQAPWMAYLNATDNAIYLLQRCLEWVGGGHIEGANSADLVVQVLAEVSTRTTFTPAGEPPGLYLGLARALVRQVLTEADLDPGLVDQLSRTVPC